MSNSENFLKKLEECISSEENVRKLNDIFKFKKGGIYINPKNKGKFNATKKRTGKTTEELAHSKNPLTRKRAIFALNARKGKKK